MHLRKPFIVFYLLISVMMFSATGQVCNFTASSTEGCTPMKVKFRFTTTATIDTVDSFYWNFGNGETSNLEDPDTVVYSVPGVYSPALIFNGNTDQTILKTDMITVHHTVPANFTYYDSVTYNVYVFEHSEPLDPGVSYTFTWDIETFSPRTGPRQIVTFPSMDTFTVALTVTDDLGCSSITVQEVLVMEDITVQNVFSPNDDFVNDLFLITSNGGFPIKVRIFTRAGILVFEAEGTTITWDGRTASGQQLNPGIYFYAIEALKGDPNKRYSKTGFLYMYK